MTGNPRCMELLKEDRPVKPNVSKLTRIKRSVSSDNNLSFSEKSGAQTSSHPTKKFETLFAGKKSMPPENQYRQEVGDGQEDEEEYEEDGSNTSRINTEDKSKAGTQNKSAKDTWNDDSENDTDSFDEQIESNNPKVVII